MYTITQYTIKRAKKIGVRVQPSSNKGKKIDVYRGNHKIGSIGALGMNDYPTYLKTKGKTYANKRRTMYKIRHSVDRKKKWSNGWLADQLLW